MLVALAITNDSLANHFGHCQYFEIYEVFENKSFIKQENIINPPHQKNFLPKFLNQHNIEVLITGSIGSMAIQGLNDLGIEVISGVSGKPEDIINQYIKKTLNSTNEPCKEHSHHNH
ncbi:MAG: NifB/NifX family molybdenum-iron cluster-binding protein [Candidatus Izemoplasmatales bacterium]|jgi:predicted Fe-Mo cluster-binding NifX family protein